MSNLSPRKKKQCAVSRHLSNVTLEGGPSNLPLFFSPRNLVFELHAAGTEGQIWKETRAQSRCMYIPRLAHVRPALAACPLLPPRRSFIMPSHTQSEGGSTAHVSLPCGELLGEKRRPGPLHNQLVSLCPKYLICINFIAAALSYLR